MAGTAQPGRRGTLKAWVSLFRDWRLRRRHWLEKADRELALVGEPEAIANPQDAATIRAYRGAMLREIELRLSITRQAIGRYRTPRWFLFS